MGPERWRYTPYNPPKALPESVCTEEDYEELQPRLALRLRRAQHGSYELTNQVQENSSLMAEIESWMVIWKIADEAFAVSHKLDTRVAELAVKSFALPGSRVTTEDQISEWANSIKKVELKHDVARGNAQMVVLLRETLAMQDHEIAHLHATGTGDEPCRITGMNEVRGTIIISSTWCMMRHC